MRLFRKKHDPGTTRDGAPLAAREDVGTNPAREATLYWRTDEGYIVAHDVSCQHEYIERAYCPTCDGPLSVVAHLNRAGQGLSELVAVCRECGTRASFVFDISNTVYQAWWAAQLGPLYVQQYDGPPREPFEPDPLFDDAD